LQFRAMGVSMVSVFSRRGVATRFARLGSRSLAKVSVKILVAGGVLLLSASLASAQAGPATQSQAGPNQRVQLEGELEIIHQDFKDGRGRYLYFLKLSDGARVPLHFVKGLPTNFLTGDHVRADGQLSDGSLILASGSTSLTAKAPKNSKGTTSTAPLPYTFGAQYTLVILVNFEDDATQPYTVADAQNMFFGTASNFFTENSYGQTWITGDIVGWYTIPISVTTCDISQIATDAQNAATAAGVNLSSYSRYVYAFPQDSACGFAGASDVGGNPSQTWINGTTASGGTSLDIHVINHELGHAFGLWHSHLYDCGTTATICSSPTIVEYGDLLDTMGVPQTASPDYNAFQKERLGWLNYGASPSIQTVQASGTYTINTYELGGSGPNALKILKSTDATTGAKTWYYLEARQAIGFDAFLTDPTYYTQNETTGVLFHIGTDGDGNSSDLLDMTPATPTTSGWFDPSLAIGQSFQDSTAGVTFTVESVTSGGAVVSVQFSGGGSPTGSTTQCTGTPALAVATNQTSYSPGQTVSITATATCGGSPAANVSVNFAVTYATGGQVTGSATTGSNGTAVYKLRLKRTAPAGTYTAGAAATIQRNALSATTQFTVQ
jgi:M6 family metalloprotease-like protein